MGKAFIVLCVALGVWAGVEVHRKGTAGAFDGALVRLGIAGAPAAGMAPTRGAGAAGGYETGADRRERADGEPRAPHTGSPGDRTAARARGLAGR